MPPGTRPNPNIPPPSYEVEAIYGERLVFTTDDDLGNVINLEVPLNQTDLPASNGICDPAARSID